MAQGNTYAQMVVEAELRLPSALVQIARFDIRAPVDTVMPAPTGYRLNHCLDPRPRDARAGFPEKWGEHRFEPIGEIFLTPPGHVVRARSQPGRQVSILCDIRRECIERWLTPETGWSDRKLAASLNVPSPHLRTLLGRLSEEVYRPGLASQELGELILGQIAIELGRFCLAIDDGPVAGGLGAWRLRLIDERMRELRSPPTLNELADLCGLSVRQLTRGFRASRGCSINDYLSNSRIESAKRMLRGRESIKTIAFATGFASPSGFACAFHRATGVTPRGWRQRMVLSAASQVAAAGPS